MTSFTEVGSANTSMMYSGALRWSIAGIQSSHLRMFFSEVDRVLLEALVFVHLAWSVGGVGSHAIITLEV